MRPRILWLLILLFLINGYSNAFAEVNKNNPYTDQERLCGYQDGTYTVNTIKSDESFLLNAGERNEIINQVIKKWWSLYFADLFFSYIWDIENAWYKFQPTITVYKYGCRTYDSQIIMSSGYWWSSNVLNGPILNAEIDMIDTKYLVVRAYNTTSKTNVHLYYDLNTNKEFFMNFQTQTTSQFNTILDFKPGKNGVGSVLMRMSNGKTKWLRYDFNKKIFY